LPPPFDGTSRLTRLVGRKRALAMILTGVPIPSEEAQASDLVSRVVPRAGLLGAAMALAASVTAQSPLAIAACLAAVTLRLNLPITAGLAVEAAVFASVLPSAGLREGLAAFREKRPRSSAGGAGMDAPPPSWTALDLPGESLRSLPRRCPAGRRRHGPSAAIHRLVRSPDMRRLLATLAGWIERARQRRRLAALSDRLLKDIGISRCDALQEARKPFWRS